MQKSILLACLVLVNLYGYEYHLLPKKVAKDVYCFFGALENITPQNGGNMVNSCFVQTKEGFVVIDSGPTFGYASQAFKQMQKIAKLPIKYVIITHDHDDHWLGNSFYKDKGALLIGPRTYEQNVVVGMQTRMQKALGEAIYAPTKVVKLDTVVEHHLALEVGEKIFEIDQFVPKAHTQGDLIIFIKEQGVLFAGDTVFNGRLTSLRDGSLIGSIKVLEMIDARNPKVIIGGHGYDTSSAATKALKGYLVTMKQQILDAIDKDIGIESITKEVTMESYKHFKLYDVLHRRNVFDAYAELEMFEEEEE